MRRCPAEFTSLLPETRIASGARAFRPGALAAPSPKRAARARSAAPRRLIAGV